jgi:hypothetical protein
MPVLLMRMSIRPKAWVAASTVFYRRALLPGVADDADGFRACFSRFLFELIEPFLASPREDKPRSLLYQRPRAGLSDARACASD